MTFALEAWSSELGILTFALHTSTFALEAWSLEHDRSGMEQRSTSDPWLQGKINVQEVGVIGQSFGGYTALALAGAHINIDQLHKDCKPESDPINPSLVLQCRALALGKNAPDYAQIQ